MKNRPFSSSINKNNNINNNKGPFSHNNPNNDRKLEELNKRVLKNYSDDTSSSILGFNKLIYHPEKLIGLKNNTNAFPLTATLSLGNYCNHGCLWCSTAYFREAEANKINYEKISNWLEKASARGLKGVGYVGNGEPLAFKMFGELATNIGDLGLDQGIFTNGYLIDRFEDVLLEHFTYIRISLDAGSKEVHAWGHDVPESHFEKIIANLEHVIAKRKDGTPMIGVQFATHQHNIDDLENCVRICQDIGIDYLSIKPIFDRGTVRDKIEKNTLTLDDFDRAYDKVLPYQNDTFKIFYRPQQVLSEENEQNMLVYNKCVAGFFGINIYEDGEITGCGPHHVSVGTLDTDMDELEENIKALVDKLDLKNCPAGCRYHALNYQVHKILNKEDFAGVEHINLF